MTARLYARVSTASQVENYSLPAQRARLEAWAAYQNIRDTVLYEDAGISGARDDRPGLAALLLDLKPGDVVVSYALSRLARGGAVQLLGIVSKIRERGARVVFLQESIDTDTPTGRLMLTILAALAELEIEQTRERTDMGRTQAALEGVYPHNPQSLPVGWTTDEAGRIVEDEHAATVRLIFQQGRATYNSTAQMLNDQGIPTPRGGTWSVVQVRRIVQYEGYATGQLVYRAATDPDAPERHVRIPAPALVSVDDWTAAQRDGRANAAHKRPEKFPLSGHLRCGCGARLSGQESHPPSDKPHWSSKLRYVCQDHVRKTPTCPTNGKRTRAYNAHDLHTAARQVIAGLLENPNDVAGIANIFASAPALPDHAAQEREDTERRLSALLDLYLEQLIDRDTYTARRATLTAHLASLSVPVAAPEPVDMPSRPDLAAAALLSPNEGFAQLLSILDAEFVATGTGELKLLGYRPIPADH